jgi:LysM repeat protein
MIRNNLKEYISRSQRDKMKPIAMIVGSLVIIGILAGSMYWAARSDSKKDSVSAKVETTNPVKTNNPEIKTESRESKAEVKTSDANTQTHAQEIKSLEDEIARLRKQNEELSLKVKNLEKQLRDTATAANRTTATKPEAVEEKKPETIKSSEEKKLAKSVDKPRGKENKISYTVKKGDTLWSIADKYGVSVSAIKEWNNLRDEKLAIGEEITVIKP